MSIVNMSLRISDMITIENNQECFVQLWLRLERTRRLLGMQYRRFCARRVLVSWFGSEATDEFVWEVCSKTVVDEEQIYGLDILPPPALYPRTSREFLRAVVSVQVFAGDIPVSCTLQFSADTYGNNQKGDLLTLCKALMAYSDSAKAYFVK